MFDGNRSYRLQSSTHKGNVIPGADTPIPNISRYVVISARSMPVIMTISFSCAVPSFGWMFTLNAVLYILEPKRLVTLSLDLVDPKPSVFGELKAYFARAQLGTIIINISLTK